jgi:aminoglycoside/choline kinase family phosphotransferase
LPALPPDFLRQREAELQAWFSRQLSSLQLGAQHGGLAAVSGDASFRRYFRATTDAGTCILVDAPPPHEDCRPFVAVDEQLSAGAVNVPALLAYDCDAGFMCLGDLGDELLWTPLEAARVDAAAQPSSTTLYQAAFAELLKIQATDAQALPPYNEALLRREMQLFIDWFCQGLLGFEQSADEQAMIERVFNRLIARAEAQPQVFVHRDYHSRNLMYRGQAALGVIDFQDAVRGPLTYDLVSLLRDCYIEWPRAQVERWVRDYAQAARAAGLSVPDDATFQQDFDWMGMQRHLKVLGIFARLWLRDGKRGYLQDLPLTLRYLASVARGYAEFDEFTRWLAARVEPKLPGVLRELGVSKVA